MVVPAWHPPSIDFCSTRSEKVAPRHNVVNAQGSCRSAVDVAGESRAVVGDSRPRAVGDFRSIASAKCAAIAEFFYPGKAFSAVAVSAWEDTLDFLFEANLAEILVVIVHHIRWYAQGWLARQKRV